MGCEPHCLWVMDMLALYDDIEFVKPDGSLDMTTNVERMGVAMVRHGLKVEGDSIHRRVGLAYLYP